MENIYINGERACITGTVNSFFDTTSKAPETTTNIPDNPRISLENLPFDEFPNVSKSPIVVNNVSFLNNVNCFLDNVNLFSNRKISSVV